jgi:hypothetical protein
MGSIDLIVDDFVQDILSIVFGFLYQLFAALARLFGQLPV